MRYLSDRGLGLTAEQQDLSVMAAEFFQTYCPPEVVRASERSGYDEKLWGRLGEILGLDSVVGDEAATLTDLVLVCEQRGRWLAPVPLVEAVVAARASGRSEGWSTVAHHPARNGLLPQVAWAPFASGVMAWVAGDLVEIPCTGRVFGVSADNLASLPIGDVEIGAERTTIATGEQRAAARWQTIETEYRILSAACLVGLAARALEVAVDYAKERKAFGITIGSFQTLAHSLADAVVRVDGTRLLVFEAAWAARTGRPEAGALASAAYGYAAETAAKVTSVALHVHGGVGYTREHDIQLYYRRARGWPLSAGDPRGEFQRVARALIADTEQVLGA